MLKGKSQIMYKSKENMMKQLMMIQKNESPLQTDFGKGEKCWNRNITFQESTLKPTKLPLL